MSDETVRILVIDDDVALTTLVSEALLSEGCETLVANDGTQGLELAYTQRPNLVLLDMTMPVMDGYQVCRELQFGYTKDIQVVFLTARSKLRNMAEANRAGASAFISKPFRVEHLLDTVRDVLRDASVYYDDITGLPTLAHVRVEVQRRLSSHRQLGILYVTLDGVHSLETMQGFEVVDDVFRTIGRRLLQAKGQLLRNEDFISISSLGNAFLVILGPAREHGFVDEDDLRLVKRRLESRLLDDLENELESSLSAGVELYVGHARLTQSPKVRFKRALLEAIAQATRHIQLERDEVQDRLGGELDRVITDSQTSCAYQPIVSLDDYGVIGYELLARGPRQSELHRPDALFETPHAQHRVPELDRLCQRMAARGSAELPEDCLRFINSEPIGLFSREHCDVSVKELVAATPAELRPHTVMEVTENSVIDDFDNMRHVVRRLREEGFRIAIDDAGPGYSGLQTMVEIEPDFIKLDVSLTRGISKSVFKQKLLGTLRGFCEDADIALIAEGVEMHSQLETLLHLGVPYWQGFLFAHPGSPFPLKERIPPRSAAAVEPPAAGSLQA